MIKRYLTKSTQKYASKWLVLCIDIVTVVLTFFLAYFIRFNLTLDFDKNKLFIQLPLLIITATVSFLFTGSFKGVVRHTGFRDVVNIFKAITLLALLNIVIVIVNKQTNTIAGYTIPLSIIIIHSLLSFLAMTSSRLIFKTVYNHLFTRLKASKKVLIYGAGNSGIITYNALMGNSRNRVHVVGYIDDNGKKIGKFINGVPIFSKDRINAKFIYVNQIDEIIVSIQNVRKSRFKEIVDSLVELPAKVKVVPPIEKWINGELRANQIKQVQIEDLLERVPIEIKNPKLQRELSGEIIMITGAAGSIGSEITRQITNYDYKQLIMVDQAESALYDLQQELKQNCKGKCVSVVADIRDKNRVDYLFQQYKPTLIFHAAAYKHVPLMEQSPYEAIKINVLGSKILADAASHYGVKKFVFISTDKAVNPTSVMGATKRIAEMYISCLQKASKTKFITTRFGNVLGSNGSVIPLFKKQIEKGGPLTVTHKDVTRYFMTIPEASQLVLEAGAMGNGGEIFIFDMGESVKIYDLALNMIKLSGLRFPEDINIQVTGLRPGEKLYEELLANGENTLPTYHKKIMISKVRELNYNKIKSDIEELCISNLFQNTNIVKKMKELVPEYKSNNSHFEVFDDENKDKLEVENIPQEVKNEPIETYRFDARKPLD